MTAGQFWLLVLILLAILAVVGLPWLLSRRRENRPFIAAEAYLDTIDALIRDQRNTAVAALQRVAREETDNVLAYLRLGDLVRTMGHGEKAYKIHMGLSARPIEDAKVRLRVQESILEDLVALERWNEVANLGESLRAENKKSAVALVALVTVYRLRGEWSRAFEAADELEQLAPGKSKLRPQALRLEAAEAKLLNKEAAEARGLLEQAIQLGASEGHERILLGDVHALEGQHERAAELWLEFARTHPDRSRQVFARLERSYYEMGKFGDLLEVYEELIESTSDSSAAGVALADMHRRRGRPEEAIHLLQSILATNPEELEARRLLIQCHLQAGQNDPAQEELEALLKRLPIQSAASEERPSLEDEASPTLSIVPPQR